MDIANFKLEYKQALTEQKELVQAITKQWEDEEKKLRDMQTSFADRYKACIVRKYMTLWSVSGKFPSDDELTKAVFYIGGLDLKDSGLDCDDSVPDTQISLNHKDCTFKFTYYNKRLKLWIVLVP